jgi:hypothetical protein
MRPEDPQGTHVVHKPLSEICDDPCFGAGWYVADRKVVACPKCAQYGSDAAAAEHALLMWEFNVKASPPDLAEPLRGTALRQMHEVQSWSRAKQPDWEI